MSIKIKEWTWTDIYIYINTIKFSHSLFYTLVCIHWECCVRKGYVWMNDDIFWEGKVKGQTVIFISFLSRMNIWVKVTRTRYKDNRGLNGGYRGLLPMILHGLMCSHQYLTWSTSFLHWFNILFIKNLFRVLSKFLIRPLLTPQGSKFELWILGIIWRSFIA